VIVSRPADRRQRGYPALLNLDEQPHWTVFLSDFALPAADMRRLQRQVEPCASRLLFIRIDRGVGDVLRKMRSAGAGLRSDYFSLHGMVCRHENLALLDALVERLPRRDLARIDVPILECGFRRSYATQALGVVMGADYGEQDQISDHFFNLLVKREPYEVTVETAGGKLWVRDNRPWFELAGRLRNGETRTLPDGEVAYSAEIKNPQEEVEGRFLVDGAVLPLAQEPRYAADARRLLSLSREVARHPFCLHIRRGTVVNVTGNGRGPGAMSDFFEKSELYRRVNEVGISFNRASTRFIHGWPAASNEVRPGAHLGIGGAANPDDDDPQRSPFVHLDCIAADCSVFVNGQPFLRAFGSRTATRRESRAVVQG
jgi:hypothetical protein